MRVHWLKVTNFKGIAAELPWAPAVVFFGPNDSGKSNLLEALLSVFGDPPTVRTERYPIPDELVADVELLIELDGRDLPRHPDRELLASLFAPTIRATSHERFDPLRKLLASFEGAQKDDRLRLADEMIEAFEEAIREEWQEDLDREGADAETRAAEMSRLEGLFTSRWFRLDWLATDWLEPPPSGIPLSDGSWKKFMELGEPDDFQSHNLLRAIRVDSSERAVEETYRRLDRFIESDLDYREYVTQSGRRTLIAQAWLRHVPFTDRWLEREGDAVSLRDSVYEACEDLEERANSLAPRFLTGSYRIRIHPHTPDEWRQVDRRVSIRLQPHTPPEDVEDFDLEISSSGMATWAIYAVSEAIRLREDERQAQFPNPREPQPRRTPTIFVFDEPERHLHPLAQEEAARWLASRVEEGGHAWLATHAVPFLRLSIPSAEYLSVTRGEDWASRVERITPDVLGAVSESAAALGQPPVAVIQLTRAWLVVEGEHDRKILDALYGRQLRSAGIQILPLRGAARAKASFLNLAALAPLGRPFICLLDNARAEMVRQNLIPASKMTEEERIAEQIIHLSRSDLADVHVEGLPFPDILCGLPEPVVAEVAGENGGIREFSGWAQLIADYNSAGGEGRSPSEKKPNFKRFALDKLGLSTWSPDDFVDAVLAASSGNGEQHSALELVVSQILAWVEGAEDKGLPGT